jgi:uncharacterized protein (TIGR03067 family)
VCVLAHHRWLLLGLLYAGGDGVEQDETKAAEWFQKAADKGLEDAMYNVALYYAAAPGVQRDLGKAAEWYRKAVGKGHAEAQYALGVMYENGRGVEKNPDEAAGWYRKAAANGSERAKKRLADKKRLAELIEGTYFVVGMETGGEKVPGELFAKAPGADRTIVIKDGKLIATKGGKEDAIAYTIDPTKTPAEITTTEAKPGGKTETLYGIYKLEGDTLTICMVESADATDRPREFKTSRESKAILMTLRKKNR